jgi:hypothetical protein
VAGTVEAELTVFGASRCERLHAVRVTHAAALKMNERNVVAFAPGLRP